MLFAPVKNEKDTKQENPLRIFKDTFIATEPCNEV